MANRILVTLGEDRIARLNKMAERQGESRSALIRHAVDTLIGSVDEDASRTRRLAALEQGFGLWARRVVPFDPVKHERQRRAEWTRPWDDDYEEVKAESPDLFDDEDDRQRRIHLDMVAGKYPPPNSPDSE